MRKWNAVLSLTALALFLPHGVLESFHLVGAEGLYTKQLPRLVLTLLMSHAAFGVKFTVDALRVWKKTGAGYFRENRLFWARRISGFVILALLFFHVGAFSEIVDGEFRLLEFTHGKLVLHLLLAASLAVHILTNLRPLMLALGVRGGQKRQGNVLFLLAVLLLFMAGAFVVYYLRWKVW